jgi:hypothetical protein
MKKVRFIDLLSDKDKTSCKITAPLHFVEGNLIKDAAKKTGLRAIEIQSDFYNSKTYFATSYYKPISQI